MTLPPIPQAPALPPAPALPEMPSGQSNFIKDHGATIVALLAVAATVVALLVGRSDTRDLLNQQSSAADRVELRSVLDRAVDSANTTYRAFYRPRSAKNDRAVAREVDQSYSQWTKIRVRLGNSDPISNAYVNVLIDFNRMRDMRRHNDEVLGRDIAALKNDIAALVDLINPRVGNERYCKPGAKTVKAECQTTPEASVKPRATP